MFTMEKKNCLGIENLENVTGGIIHVTAKTILVRSVEEGNSPFHRHLIIMSANDVAVNL